MPAVLADPAFQTEDELRRRENFAQAYCASCNLTQAAITAGYSGKHVRVTASRLLKEPHVRARINEITEQLRDELKITQRAVLAEYSRIAFLDGGELFDDAGNPLMPKDMPASVRHAVAGYTVERKTFGSGDDAMEVEKRELKLVSKTDALAKLSQHLQLFKGEGGGGSITAEEMLAVMLEARNRLFAHRRTQPAVLEHDG